MMRQDNDNDELFVLDQHAYLDYYSVSSLKQSAGRHVSPLGDIILIPRQPVLVLNPYCCMISGEAENSNLIVFDFTRYGLEPTIYRT